MDKTKEKYIKGIMKDIKKYSTVQERDYHYIETCMRCVWSNSALALIKELKYD